MPDGPDSALGADPTVAGPPADLAGGESTGAPTAPEPASAPLTATADDTRPPAGDPPPLSLQPGYGPPPAPAQPGYGPPPVYGPPAYGPPPGWPGLYSTPGAVPYPTPLPGPPAYGPPAYGPPPYGTTPAYGPPSAAPPRQRTPEERRRRRRRLVSVGVVVVAFVAGIAIGVWAIPRSTPPSPSALVDKAIAAGTAAGTFRYVERSTTDGRLESIAGAAAPSSGRQQITTAGASGTDRFDLRLVGGVVYFRGNRAAVIDQLGVPAATAPGVVNRWVSLHKGQGPYQSFAEGVTAASNLSQIPTVIVGTASAPVSGSTPAATRITGGLYVGKGHPAVGTAAMVITTSSSLPQSIKGLAVSGDGARLAITWTYSHWRGAVTVVAPKTSVPYPSLGATAPSTGA